MRLGPRGRLGELGRRGRGRALRLGSRLWRCCRRGWGGLVGSFWSIMDEGVLSVQLVVDECVAKDVGQV